MLSQAVAFRSSFPGFQVSKFVSRLVRNLDSSIRDRSSSNITIPRKTSLELVRDYRKNTRRSIQQWKKLYGQIYSKQIEQLAKQSDLSEALLFLDEVKGRKLRVDTAVYNMLIGAYADRGEIRNAFSLFNTLKKHSLTPDKHTYTSLFHGCAVAGPQSLQILNKVVAEMDRHSIVPSTITCNAMIKAFAMCEQPDRAFDMHNTMIQQCTRLDIRTFSALLMASLAKTNTNGLELAIRTWEELRVSYVKVDVESYNLFIQCLRDCTYDEKLLQLVPENKRKLGGDRNCVVDSVHWSVDIELSRDHCLQLYITSSGSRRLRLLQIMDALKADDLEPNIKTFHLLCSLVPFKAHKSLFEFMDMYHITCDTKFFNGFLRRASKRGIGYEKAMELMAVMKRKKLQPDDRTYQAIASTCRGEDDSKQLLSIIEANGHCPNEYVWGTLVGTATKYRKYLWLSALLKGMKYSGFKPNSEIIAILDSAAKCTIGHDKPYHFWPHRDGFKGHYYFWRKQMWKEDQDQDHV